MRPPKLKFLLCLFLGGSFCSHSIAQTRSRVVSPSNTKDSPQFALKSKATLAGHQSQVFSVVLSPDGGLMATSDDDSTRVWTTNGQFLYTMDRAAPLFSADGRAILTIDKRSANLWDSVTGKLKLTLTGHEGNITEASFSPDGSTIATGSEDGTVKLWDIATGRVSTTLTVLPVKKIPRYRIFSRITYEPVKIYVKFSPDGKFIATCSVEYVARDIVKLWDTATGTLIKEVRDVFSTMDFSPDSKWLGFLRIGEDVGVLNVETLQIQTTSDVDTNFLNQHVFSPDSGMYVTASGDNKYFATLIDISTGRVTRKIPLAVKWGFDPISNYQKDADILSFHPSSRFLMGANHRSVRLWNVSTGDVVFETLEGRDPAVFSSDGKVLVTVGKDKKTVLVWDVLTN